MKKRLSTTLTLLISALIVLVTPAFARADSLPGLAPSDALAALVITEVQPGTSANASEEFVELYNAGDQAIEFADHDWRLQIASSTATSWDAPLRSIALTGRILPGTTYVLASQFSSSSQTVQYLPGVAQQWFSAGISATAGHVRVVVAVNRSQSDGACSPALTPVDEVEWSAAKDGQPATPSIDGRPVYLTASTSGIAKATSLQRLTEATGSRRYVDRENDFTDLTVGAPSPAALNVFTLLADTQYSTLPPGPLPVDDCSNDPVPADDPPPLSPTEQSPPAVDPPSGPASDPPTATVPAPQDLNAGLLAPQLSEILPNPASPQTDAADEFIELYNPNAATLHLDGFGLTVGLTTQHHYAFPVGTILAPHAFVAFYSAATHLSLSNSGGRVILTDQLGRTLAQSADYGTAKDGQTWVLAHGQWQWTTEATPNATNILVPPVAKNAIKPKTPGAKTAKVKAASTSKKTNTAKTAKTKAEPAAQLAAAPASSFSPLHPQVLAVAALIALLYGAYEYRGDLANKFHRLRQNRSARRQARGSAEGRGSH